MKLSDHIKNYQENKVESFTFDGIKLSLVHNTNLFLTFVYDNVDDNHIRTCIDVLQHKLSNKDGNFHVSFELSSKLLNDQSNLYCGYCKDDDVDLAWSKAIAEFRRNAIISNMNVRVALSRMNDIVNNIINNSSENLDIIPNRD